MTTESFRAEVRSVKPREGKVEVTFKGRAAIYWCRQAQPVLQVGRQVQVEWNPATGEITTVRP